MIKFIRLSTLSTILFIAVTNVIIAQSPLITDRPDDTEAAGVMAPGSLQIEFGFTTENETITLGELKTITTGALFRYGLFENFEFRFQIDHLDVELKDFGASNGIGPLSAGMKVSLVEESGNFPAVSLLGSVTFSETGKNVFQVDNIAPSFRFIIAKDINETLSLGSNFGMEWDGRNPKPVMIATLAAGISVTDWIGTFVEISLTRNLTETSKFNFGFTFWVWEDIQLDAGYSIGLTDDSIDDALTLGASFRLFD